MTGWGQLGYMLSMFVVYDARYRVRFHSNKFGYLSDGQNAGSMNFSDLHNLLIGEFSYSASFTSPHSSVPYGVCGVVFLRVPAEVFGAVIGRAPVVVASDCSVWSGTNKRLKYQMMNKSSFGTWERNDVVPASYLRLELENLSSPPSSILSSCWTINGADSPVGRYLICPFVSDNPSPFLRFARKKWAARRSIKHFESGAISGSVFVYILQCCPLDIGKSDVGDISVFVMANTFIGARANERFKDEMREPLSFGPSVLLEEKRNLPEFIYSWLARTSLNFHVVGNIATAGLDRATHGSNGSKVGYLVVPFVANDIAPNFLGGRISHQPSPVKASRGISWAGGLESHFSSRRSSPWYDTNLCPSWEGVSA